MLDFREEQGDTSLVLLALNPEAAAPRAISPQQGVGFNANSRSGGLTCLSLAVFIPDLLEGFRTSRRGSMGPS